MLLTQRLKSDIAVVFLDIDHIVHVCLHVLYVKPVRIKANLQLGGLNDQTPWQPADLILLNTFMIGDH